MKYIVLTLIAVLCFTCLYEPNVQCISTDLMAKVKHDIDAEQKEAYAAHAAYLLHKRQHDVALGAFMTNKGSGAFPIQVVEHTPTLLRLTSEGVEHRFVFNRATIVEYTCNQMSTKVQSLSASLP